MKRKHHKVKKVSTCSEKVSPQSEISITTKWKQYHHMKSQNVTLQSKKVLLYVGYQFSWFSLVGQTMKIGSQQMVDSH